MLEERVRRCLDAGTSVLVGTANAQGMPSCCRAVAITSDDELKTVRVYLPVATSQQIIQDIATTHRLAVAATHVVEHFSVQLKGTAHSARLAREDEAAFVESRQQAFGDVIHSVGVPRRLTRSIVHWPAFVVDMRVEDIFEQTPGPKAGSRDPMTGPLRLSDLSRCFQGIVPSIIATADGRGVPNITYISQVYFVDDRHVALSCQFFNKTRRNLDENPAACVEVVDPLTLQAYRLRLKFLRSEKSGPLFDRMALRIDAIASHTGMSGVFRLIAADVFEVQSLEMVQGFLTEPPADVPEQRMSIDGMRTELRGLQLVSDRINQACDLESLLEQALGALEEYFKFAHTSVLLCDETGRRLVTLASRGYGESGIGAEVVVGEGLIGTVARERRLLRLTSLEGDLRYGRAIRRETTAGRRDLAAEIPLPGLPDAQSILIIPLVVGDRLIGVFMAEDRDPMRFGEWHEAYLEIIANQIALGIDRMLDRPDEGPEPVAVAKRPVPAPRASGAGAMKSVARCRRFIYYRSDDAIFVDDQYLIRNIPARILWKVLGESKRTGRTDFSNREMRLDASLGLPPVKDNLESRLILLRHRLREKCPDLQIVSTARGRFALRSDAAIELVER